MLSKLDLDGTWELHPVAEFSSLWWSEAPEIGSQEISMKIENPFRVTPGKYLPTLFILLEKDGSPVSSGAFRIRVYLHYALGDVRVIFTPPPTISRPT